MTLNQGEFQTEVVKSIGFPAPFNSWLSLPPHASNLAANFD
jgi:hypothetical protein